jgi:hypothetical protein
MTTKTAQPCGCEEVIYQGKKARRECEHGNSFVGKSLRSVSPKRQAEEDAGTRPKRHGSTMKRSEPARDWTDARAKVDEEGCCRICKRSDRKLESAHVLGREHDEPKVNKATGEILKELYVHPDRIFPACGPFPDGCHGDVDLNRVNYLQYLTLEEQVQAVRDAGGIDAARVRLAPVETREEREAAAYSEDTSPSPAYNREPSSPSITSPTKGAVTAPVRSMT